jgi:hypothetical protein
MLRAQRRIERLEKSFALSRGAKAVDMTVVFIDTDGVVKSELRLSNGRREWIRDPAEIARSG